MVYRTQLESSIYDIIKPSVLGMGYDVVRIRINSGKRTKNLQIMMERIDKNPFTIGDCEKASNHLSRVLNVEEVIEGDYNLEISSPGLNKPLTRLKDFEEPILEFIKIAIRVSIDNQRNFFGQIISFSDEIIKLKLVDSEKIIEIPFVDVFDANVEYFYGKNKLKKVEKPKLKSKKGVRKA
jgi:ribosome maturation factor RimP